MARGAFGLAIAALLSLAVPHPGMAQDQAKPRRVGVLVASSPSDPAVKLNFEALVDGLRRRGWEEGRNVVIEGRFTGPDLARLPTLAEELVVSNVDVILAATTQATEALRRKTATIPIVMVSVTDPVGSGLVASFARPGGNITGLANQMETASGKHLELLKAVKPGIDRIGIMYNPDNAGSAISLKYQQEQMASRLGLVAVPIPVSKPGDFDAALAIIARERLHALLVHSAPPLFTHRERIAVFAIEHHLPTVSGHTVMARAGLLMSYGPDLAESFRRAASYVDRIFKGANPAELPVELADRYELAVNLKTARELGLTIPPSIMLRADDVIE